MKHLILFLFILFLTTELYAQWVQTNGPYGGSIRCFAVDGKNLFAGTNNGVFLSTNNGTSWISISSGLPRENVSALAVCGTKLFAGFDCTGVWASTNKGTNWAPTSLTEGFNYRHTDCSCTTFGPFIVADSNFYVGACGAIWRSKDYGKSWSLLKPPNLYLVQALAASGADLYAGIWGLNPYTNCNLYKSTNYGETWTAVNRNWTDDNSMAIAVSGKNLFVGNSSGVFRSTDDGGSWMTMNTGLTDRHITTLTIIGGDLYAGTQGAWVFRSTNYGLSWNAAESGSMNHGVSCLTELGGYIFAGTDGLGIFASTDNGTSWNQVSSGLPYSKGVALSTCGTNLLARGNYNCMFLSTDSGDNWIPLNTGMSVLCTAPMGAAVIAGTNDGVYISTNNGITWSHAGLKDSIVPTIAVLNNNIFVGNDNGVFLSTNNGMSWERSNSGLTDTAVCALAVSGTTLFAGTSSGGIFRSVNNGSTWGQVVNDSIYPPVRSFLVKGANLFALRRYPPRFRKKTLAIQSDLVLDTVVALEGIYLSTDHGVNWVYTGLNDITVNSLLAASENLIAGTDGHGVFLSSNNGETWEAKNEELTDSSIASLALLGAELFAGTYEHGVLKRPLSEIVTSVEEQNTLPIEYSLSQNFPNPFNPTTKIKYTIPKDVKGEESNVKILVFDILGSEVVTLVNQNQKPGNYEVEFDAEKLSSGVYFYKLQAGNFVETKKMILLR